MKVCVFIFFISPLMLAAQARLSFIAGYGTYSMKDLKRLGDEVHKSYPVSMKTLSSYPAYFNFEGSFAYQSHNAFFWGLIVGYGSTGGRIHYSDYSGFIRYDQLVKYFSVNASLGLTKRYTSQKMLLCFDLRPGVTATTFDLLYNYEIGATRGDESHEFKSTNLAVQPTVSLNKRMGSFGVVALAGMNVNVVRGKLKHKENKDVYLQDSGGALKADWTGLRVGIGLSYYVGD